MATAQERADARRRGSAAARTAAQAPALAPTPAPTPAPKAAAPAAPGPLAGLDPNVDWVAVKSYVDFVKVVQERFPSWAWALDDPDIGPLLKRAAGAENWSVAVFKSNLKATPWWQARTAAQRGYDIGQDTQGDADKAKIQADAETIVSNEAGKLGVTLNAGQITDLAKQYLRNGWTPQELTGSLIQNDPTGPGDITASRSIINGIAADYMVKIDNGTVSDMANRVMGGSMTAQGVTEYVKNIAKQRFPGEQLGKQIDAGVTLKQYFQPHRQAIADALNLSADAVDLTDARFRPVLSIRDGDTVAPMTIGQVDRFARTLDEHWQTPDGRAQQATTGRNLLKLIGVLA